MAQGGNRVRDTFRKVATTASAVVGSPWAFLLAFSFVILWAISGPWFRFSDTWQLVINSTSSIVTFLVAFLIQNTQSRDAKAIHLKLDELLRAVGKARTGLVGLEEMSDDELDRLHEQFERLREKKRNAGAPIEEAPLPPPEPEEAPARSQ
jgi:low affinity Fe/Cu permease